MTPEERSLLEFIAGRMYWTMRVKLPNHLPKDLHEQAVGIFDDLKQRMVAAGIALPDED